MSQLDLEKFKPALGDWFFRLEKIFASKQMYDLYQELKELKIGRAHV